MKKRWEELDETTRAHLLDYGSPRSFATHCYARMFAEAEMVGLLSQETERALRTALEKAIHEAARSYEVGGPVGRYWRSVLEKRGAEKKRRFEGCPCCSGACRYETMPPSSGEWGITYIGPYNNGETLWCSERPNLPERFATAAAAEERMTKHYAPRFRDYAFAVRVLPSGKTA